MATSPMMNPSGSGGRLSESPSRRARLGVTCRGQAEPPSPACGEERDMVGSMVELLKPESPSAPAAICQDRRASRCQRFFTESLSP